MLMVMLQELVITALALVIVMVVALALIGPTQGPRHGSWEADDGGRGHSSAA